MPPKILIIDDDPRFVSTIRERLVFEGYEVIQAYDGDEGLEILKHECPDAIVVDFFMPKLNGYAFIKMFQKQYGSRNTAIIVCTGRVDVMDAVKSEGISGFLVKPFDPFELIKILKVIFQFFQENDVYADFFKEKKPKKNLPHAPKATEPRPEPKQEKPRIRDRKMILIVEDEKSFAETVRMRLEHEGYDVLHAENGKIGLDIARREIPDLILLDVMMPIITGHMVCRILKSTKKLKHIPIIVITARALEEDRRLSLSSGAECFVSKPLDLNELLKTIRWLLEKPKPDK